MRQVVIVFGLWLLIVFVQVTTSYQGRKDLVEKDRADCVNVLLGRADAIGADREEADWRNAAADARHDSGDHNVEAQYRDFADSADERAERRELRLMGARLGILQDLEKNRPSKKALAEAHSVCDRAHPFPPVFKLTDGFLQ